MPEIDARKMAINCRENEMETFLPSSPRPPPSYRHNQSINWASLDKNPPGEPRAQAEICVVTRSRHVHYNSFVTADYNGRLGTDLLKGAHKFFIHGSWQKRNNWIGIQCDTHFFLRGLIGGPWWRNHIFFPGRASKEKWNDCRRLLFIVPIPIRL